MEPEREASSAVSALLSFQRKSPKAESSPAAKLETPTTPGNMKPKRSKAKSVSSVVPCTSCGVTQSTHWRWKDGERVCNACGLKGWRGSKKGSVPSARKKQRTDDNTTPSSGSELVVNTTPTIMEFSHLLMPTSVTASFSPSVPSAMTPMRPYFPQFFSSQQGDLIQAAVQTQALFPAPHRDSSVDFFDHNLAAATVDIHRSRTILNSQPSQMLIQLVFPDSFPPVSTPRPGSHMAPQLAPDLADPQWGRPDSNMIQYFTQPRTAIEVIPTPATSADDKSMLPRPLSRSNSAFSTIMPKPQDPKEGDSNLASHVVPVPAVPVTVSTADESSTRVVSGEDRSTFGSRESSGSGTGSSSESGLGSLHGSHAASDSMAPTAMTA
eukprot:GILK01003450.1.p1 GENE.GILK01003450.1~~GILK01003450.1.p1  ORF type:complete len:429 (+),score=62.51 GILK01003450.1:146-1288(+)